MAIKTMDDLFDLALAKSGGRGAGSVHIASFLGLNQASVEKWKDYGILMKHWSALVSEYGVTSDELYQICAAIKQKIKKAA